jgi:hypothetical protein
METGCTTSEKRNWNNKEERSQYMKPYCIEYYKARRAVLNSKVKCDCGKEICVSSYKKHLKSRLHSFNLLSAEEKLEAIKQNIMH